MATATAKKKSVFGKDGPKKLKGFKEPERDESENFKPIEHVGEIVVLYVHGIEEVQTKRYGVRDAAKVDVRRLVDGKLTEPMKKILIFNTAIVGQLEDSVTETIAARIGVYESQSGGDAPRLEELEADELEEVEALIG